MSAVLPPIAGPGAIARARSEGVWRAAWSRMRKDKVGVVSLGVVLLFVLLIVLMYLMPMGIVGGVYYLVRSLRSPGAKAREQALKQRASG